MHSLAVFVDLASELHSTTTELGRMSSRHLDSILRPITSAQVSGEAGDAQHKSAQAERRASLGVPWVGPDKRDEDLVCDRGDGGPIDPDAFTHAFKRIASKAGLPGTTRLHDVRHAVATAMLASGVETKLASAVLGHSSAAFTADQYMHVLRGMTRAATGAIDRAIGT